MVLKINFDLISNNLVSDHKCKLKFDPELDNIITFTHHIYKLLFNDKNLIFSIFFNGRELPIWKYRFLLLIEEIEDYLDMIDEKQDFSINFYEQGDTIMIKFTRVGPIYCIEIFDSINMIKLDEYGIEYIKPSDIKNILESVMDKFIEITEKYCIRSYENKYFKKIFKNYLLA